MPIAARLLISLLALLILLGGIAVSVTWALGRVGTSGTTSTHRQWEQSLDDATLLSAQVFVDTGRVELGPTLPAGPSLPSGTAMMAESVTPETAPATVNWYPLDDDAFQVDFGAAAANFPATVLRWLREPDATEWDIALTPAVPVSLAIDMSRGSARVDLTGMTLIDLLVQVGVGSVDIVVDQSTGMGQIRVGVGDATLRVPDDVPVRIDTGESSSVVLGDGFFQDGASIVNAAWRERDDSSTGVSLIVESGAGTVNLVTLHHVTSSISPDPLPPIRPIADASARGPFALPGPTGAAPPVPALTASRPIGDGTARIALQRTRGRPNAGRGRAWRPRSACDRKAPE